MIASLGSHTHLALVQITGGDPLSEFCEYDEQYVVRYRIEGR